jgi:chromosome segregation ATPase
MSRFCPPGNRAGKIPLLVSKSLKKLPCYTAEMEIEALRRQLSEEIATQFEAKLREAKRQKSQIEEEFEQSSEKWRTERRRLNSEIDRLESALAEARQSGRDLAEARPDLAVDPEQIAKFQAAADETIKEASEAWEKERGRLQAEISRLQEGIAQLIERSNNPLRANQVDRGKLDSKYEEAVRARRQAEEALVAAKAQWEAEKRTLTETAKHSASNAAATLPRKADEQLDNRLKEAVRLQEELASDLEKARQELSRLKEAHSTELQTLTARLLAAKNEWESEKASLLNEGTRLRQSTSPASTALKEDEQFEKRLQEAIRTRDGLAADLEKTREELGRLKDSHNTELQNMTARLQAAKSEWHAEKASIAAEATKLRQSAAASASPPRKGDEQLDKRLQEAIRTREALAADLEKSKHEIAKLKETHSAELQDFTGRYIKTRSDLEKQLRESEEARGKLERELEKTQQTLEQATQAAPASPPDGALSEEVSRLKKELDEIQEERKRLVVRLAESSDLGQQFEGRIQELVLENTQLAERVKNAASQMDVVYVKTADGSGDNRSVVSTLDSSVINEEVKRIEELTAEIARLIDDPETELATVIRKNVERAALDAYLKGILFSLGRGKKL